MKTLSLNEKKNEEILELRSLLATALTRIEGLEKRVEQLESRQTFDEDL